MFNFVIASGAALITAIMIITVIKERKIKELSKQLIDNDNVLQKLLAILLVDKEFDNCLLIDEHRSTDPCIEWNGLNLYLSPLLGVRIIGAKNNNFIYVTISDYLKTLNEVKELSLKQLNILIYNILYYCSELKTQSLDLNSKVQPLLQLGYQKYLNGLLEETFKLIERGNETYFDKHVINYASDCWIISFSFERNLNNSKDENANTIKIVSFLRSDLSINFFKSTVVNLDGFNSQKSVDFLNYALFRTLKITQA